jgi:hypothetical protein
MDHWWKLFCGALNTFNKLVDNTMTRDSKYISIGMLLYKLSPRLLIFSVGIGVIAGGLYSLIIPFVLHGVSEMGSEKDFQGLPQAASALLNRYYIETFFGLCFLILLADSTTKCIT